MNEPKREPQAKSVDGLMDVVYDYTDTFPEEQARIEAYAREWEAEKDARIAELEAALAAQGAGEPVVTVMELIRDGWSPHRYPKGLTLGSMLYTHPPAPEQAEVLKDAESGGQHAD